MWIISFINAKNIESEILCNSEIAKDKPDVEVVQKFCTKTAEYYLNKEDFLRSSLYYVLAGKRDKVVYQNRLSAKDYLLKTANDLYLVGVSYKFKGDYIKAVDLYKKSLSIKEIVLEKKSLDIAQGYNSLASLYHDIKLYSKALTYYQKALAIREEILGIENVEIANSYNNVGLLYYDVKEYVKALTYHQKALRIREKRLGIENALTATSYDNIGLIYHDTGEYTQALALYQKALRIREKVLDKNDFYLTYSYNNLGSFYQDIGDYVQALMFYKKSLVIKQEKLGTNNVSVALGYNNLGLLYQDMGDYLNALEYYQKSLAICESLNNTDAAQTYNNIGSLYQLLGNYNEALTYYQKSLAIREAVFGVENLDTAESYNNLASLYQEMKNYPLAKEFYEKSLTIREQKLGHNHISVAQSYNNMGLVEKLLRDYAESLKYYHNALSIALESSQNVSSITQIYNNLASLYQDSTKYDKAKEYYEKALAIRKKILGENHILTSVAHNNLGLLYFDMKANDKAYYHLNKSLDIFLRNRDNNFNLLSMVQNKEQYLKVNSYKMDFLLQVSNSYLQEQVHRNHRVKTLKRLTTNWLNYKGSVFDSENSISTLYNMTKNKELKEQIETFYTHQRILAMLYQNIPNNHEKWQEDIEIAKKNMALQTREIAKKSTAFKEEEGLKFISYKEIIESLQDDELYLDFAKAGDYYYIFALDSQEQIEFVQIDKNSTKKIDMLIKDFKNEIGKISDKLNKVKVEELKIVRKMIKESTSNSQKRLAQLHRLIIEPIKEILQGKKSLIISPDGALRLLPFEALYDKEEKKYLIQNKEICYIPSGKEFVRLHKYIKSRVAINHKTVIFAHPNFESKESGSYHEQLALIRGTNENIIRPFFTTLYSELNGTREEAKAIAKIMENNITFEWNRANETNLLRVTQPKILHIATHGFFINAPNIPNPMLKSGIVLSGINHSARHKKGYGSVTALKLSGLNLRGTDLVVLSACETGVVDSNSTDSISGLGKAFIQAGAKDVVMSLWSVDDNATKELMIDFYRGIKKHSNYSRALREAKVKMIDGGRHPFYWGGFVLNGL